MMVFVFILLGLISISGAPKKWTIGLITAGVLFGGSGGVTEAVLRFAVEKATGEPLHSVDFEAVRGEKGLRRAEVALGR